MNKVKMVAIKKDVIVGLVKDTFELKTKKEAEEMLEKFDKIIESVKGSLNVNEKASVGSYVELSKVHVDAKDARNPKTGEVKPKEAHNSFKIKGKTALNKAE